MSWLMTHLCVTYIICLSKGKLDSYKQLVADGKELNEDQQVGETLSFLHLLI